MCWFQAYFLGCLTPLQLQREDEAQHVHSTHVSIAHFPEHKLQELLVAFGRLSRDLASEVDVTASY